MQKGSLLMHQRDEGALTIRDISREQHIGGAASRAMRVDEIVESLARLGREQHGLGIATTEAQSINAIEKIDFIDTVSVKRSPAPISSSTRSTASSCRS